MIIAAVGNCGHVMGQNLAKQVRDGGGIRDPIKGQKGCREVEDLERGRLAGSSGKLGYGAEVRESS